MEQDLTLPTVRIIEHATRIGQPVKVEVETKPRVIPGTMTVETLRVTGFNPLPVARPGSVLTVYVAPPAPAILLDAVPATRAPAYHEFCGDLARGFRAAAAAHPHVAATLHQIALILAPNERPN